jgi:hypothetical protein
LKSLVVVTGAEKFIMETWLPSLREKGRYDGDVLIVDYFDNDSISAHYRKRDGLAGLKGFSDETISYIQSQKNIIYRKVHNVYNCMASDRINGFYECLKPLWVKYDVILITDGNDIEFLQPIQPLLDMAKNQLCATCEPLLNSVYEDWKPVSKFPAEYWSSVKDQPLINAGVIAGKSTDMEPLLKFMLENMRLYSSEFGSEQLSLNVWHYHYKHFIKDVGCKWNCLAPHTSVDMSFTFKITTGFPTEYVPYFSYPIKNKRLEKASLTDFNGAEIEISILHMHERSKYHIVPISVGVPLKSIANVNPPSNVTIIFICKGDFAEYHINDETKQKIRKYHENFIQKYHTEMYLLAHQEEIRVFNRIRKEIIQQVWCNSV